MTRTIKSSPAKPTKPRRATHDDCVVTSAGECRRKSDLTGKILIAAMQASPNRDIDLAPERGPMPVREVVL